MTRLIFFALVSALAAPGQQTFTGTITDTMCQGSHKAMNIAPDAKCVRDCVGMGKQWKYALLVEKNKVYTLSDQQTPAKFAAQKVRITGTLEKTGIIKVDRIEAMR